MAFAPSSTVYVCNVDFDDTYKNVRYFGSASARNSYLMGKAVKTYSEYLTVRTHRPGGGVRSSIKVNDNIDDLQGAGANYLIYQNANHGSRWFFAFITEFVYVNENTTEIVFETDVYQTWIHDVTIMPSYVVREHCVQDDFTVNIPEPINAQDFIYEEIEVTDYLKDWGYLLASTEALANETAKGRVVSGVYQGLFFYYFTNVDALNNVLTQLEEQGFDCVVFITLIPAFNMGGSNYAENGLLSPSSTPNSVTVSVSYAYAALGFDGYIPRNKKLGMYPYQTLVVTNHAGDEAEYAPEDFPSQETIKFKMWGDISGSPSISIAPLNYKGISTNYDAGLTITSFPQCSINTDTYKLWLAKNQFSQPMGYLGAIGSIVGGAAAIMGTGGIGTGVGAGAIAAGVSQFINTANADYQAKKEPNRAQTGASRCNLLTAIGFNKFSFYARKIKADRARTIDDFFTMYGYQTNRVKVPNMSSRPFYNYVQTGDVNIRGDIPNTDMARLKQIFNSGVTFWKSGATVGDYTIDNQPS